VLTEISGEPASSSEIISTADNWSTQTQAIFRDVKQLDRLVGELFIDSKGSSSSEAAAHTLLATIPRLIARLERLEQTLSQ